MSDVLILGGLVGSNVGAWLLAGTPGLVLSGSLTALVLGAALGRIAE